MTTDLPLLVLWEDFLAWLFPLLEKVPRTARQTFASRIQTLALDVLSHLVDARFGNDKLPPLRRASRALEQIRALIRLAHTLRLVSPAAYRHASERLDETGRMLGGWIRSAAARGAATA